jgi:hypothetical protein
MPPLTEITCAVTYAASSEVRNDTTPATSSGKPGRFMGTSNSMALAHPRGGRDDSANAAVGALLLASKYPTPVWGDIPDDVDLPWGIKSHRTRVSDYDPFRGSVT